MMDDDFWDNFDWCYECTGYGDDYYYDEELDEFVYRCETCFMRQWEYDD